MINCSGKTILGKDGYASSRCGSLTVGWLTDEQFVAKLPKEGITDLGVHNSLAVGKDGKIRWNGEPVTDDLLTSYVQMIKEMHPVPDLYVYFPDSVPCTRVEAVRKIIAPICEQCIEQSKKDWRRVSHF